MTSTHDSTKTASVLPRQGANVVLTTTAVVVNTKCPPLPGSFYEKIVNCLAMLLFALTSEDREQVPAYDLYSCLSGARPHPNSAMARGVMSQNDIHNLNFTCAALCEFIKSDVYDPSTDKVIFAAVDTLFRVLVGIQGICILDPVLVLITRTLRHMSIMLECVDRRKLVRDALGPFSWFLYDPKMDDDHVFYMSCLMRLVGSTVVPVDETSLMESLYTRNEITNNLLELLQYLPMTSLSHMQFLVCFVLSHKHQVSAMGYTYVAVYMNRHIAVTNEYLLTYHDTETITLLRWLKSDHGLDAQFGVRCIPRSIRNKSKDRTVPRKSFQAD
jgi:hypothetical protein